MALPFSVDSQAFLPWNETGWQYTSKRTNSSDVTIALSRCAFYPGRISQAAPSNMVYTASDGEARFGFTDIAGIGTGYDPKPGDRMTPPGKSERVVISVLEAPMLQFWACVLRDLVLAYDLRDIATIIRYDSTPSDEDGLRVATPTELETGVPCRMQPDSNTAEADLNGQFATRKTFTAYLNVEVEILAGDVIEVDGVKYNAIMQANRSQVDTLTTVTCELVT